VPGINDTFFITVRGGINPGETRTIRTNAFGLSEDVNPESLIVEASILDVQDAQQRQLIREVTLMGAPREKSPQSCV
jgi:hypothetical protein